MKNNMIVKSAVFNRDSAIIKGFRRPESGRLSDKYSLIPPGATLPNTFGQSSKSSILFPERDRFLIGGENRFGKNCPETSFLHLIDRIGRSAAG